MKYITARRVAPAFVGMRTGGKIFEPPMNADKMIRIRIFLSAFIGVHRRLIMFCLEVSDFILTRRRC